jgi:hypothetical protein
LFLKGAVGEAKGAKRGPNSEILQVKPICDLLCREKQFFCTIWQVWLSFGTFHSLSVKLTSETVRDRRKWSTNNSKLKTK